MAGSVEDWWCLPRSERRGVLIFGGRRSVWREDPGRQRLLVVGAGLVVVGCGGGVFGFGLLVGGVWLVPAGGLVGGGWLVFGGGGCGVSCLLGRSGASARVVGGVSVFGGWWWRVMGSRSLRGEGAGSGWCLYGLVEDAEIQDAFGGLSGLGLFGLFRGAFAEVRAARTLTRRWPPFPMKEIR